MTDPHTPSQPPLAADDPRISEWLDGRLAPADAEDVERAVQASPELVALVDDLRMIRGAMLELPADSVPEGLSDSIMIAIASGQPTSALSLPLGEAGRRPGEGALEAESIPPTPPGEAINSGLTPTARQDSQNSGLTPTARQDAARQDSRQREAIGRRMPWLAILGALAAGILATVVVNLPREDGREVALAPAPPNQADAKKVSEGKTAIDSRRENQRLAAATGRAGEEIAASEDELAANAPLGEAKAPLGEDDSHQASRFADAGGAGGGFDAERDADELKMFDAPAESLTKSRALAERGDESIERGRQYRMKESEAISPQEAGAPPSPAAPFFAATEEPRFVAPAPATEPPFVPPVPATEAPAREVAGAVAEKHSLAPVDALRQQDGLAKQAASPGLRRAAALPAGIVVITVGQPSDRRALDHLVAASGLEVTREPDRFELVGEQPAIDGFLLDLEEAGLVPRGAAPRKRKNDTKDGRELRSLVLRIVDRKAKPGSAAASKEKP